MQVLLLHDGGYVWGLLGVEVSSMSGANPTEIRNPRNRTFRVVSARTPYLPTARQKYDAETQHARGIIG